MPRYFVLFLVLMFAAPSWSAPSCNGTTEELLLCYSPEVKDFLGRWARAWGNGDIETYLSLYTSARSPRDDLTRSEWEAHRRARIGPEKQIELNLKLESMGLEDSGIFDVIFTQHYRSATFEDQIRKRLFLLREAGERQRLILARSLLQDRPVLILDESMSNLDPQTEAEFLKVLTKLKSSKTIIMNSHRHHLAEIADQVITINEH